MAMASSQSSPAKPVGPSAAVQRAISALSSLSGPYTQNAGLPLSITGGDQYSGPASESLSYNPYATSSAGDITNPNPTPYTPAQSDAGWLDPTTNSWTPGTAPTNLDPALEAAQGQFGTAWGSGDPLMNVDDVRSTLSKPAWDVYNALIQAHPELSGKIYNPDYIAQALEKQAGAAPDPESNLIAYEGQIQNALLNQPAVLDTRGGQYIDVTSSPEAQQAIQQGQLQAQANQDNRTKYGAPSSAWTGFTKGVLNTVTDPLFQMALAAASFGAAAAGSAAADAAAGTAEAAAPAAEAATSGGALGGIDPAALDTAAAASGDAGAAGTETGLMSGVDPSAVDAQAAASGASGAAGAPSGGLTSALQSAGKAAAINAAKQLGTTGKIDPGQLVAAAVSGGAGAAVSAPLSSALSDSTGLSPGISNVLANSAVNVGSSAIQGGNPLASGVGSLVGGATGLGASTAGAPGAISGALGTIAGQEAGQAVGAPSSPTATSNLGYATSPSGYTTSAPPSSPSASGSSQDWLAPPPALQNLTPPMQLATPTQGKLLPTNYYTYGTPVTAAQTMSGNPNPIPFKRGGSVWGAGGGQDDLIPAYLADGEYVMDAQVVSALGGGSSKHGAKLLDEFRKQIRDHSRSTPVDKIPPKPKSALEYLKAAKKAI